MRMGENEDTSKKGANISKRNAEFADNGFSQADYQILHHPDGILRYLPCTGENPQSIPFFGLEKDLQYPKKMAVNLVYRVGFRVPGGARGCILCERGALL